MRREAQELRRKAEALSGVAGSEGAETRIGEDPRVFPVHLENQSGILQDPSVRKRGSTPGHPTPHNPSRGSYRKRLSRVSITVLSEGPEDSNAG